MIGISIPVVAEETENYGVSNPRVEYGAEREYVYYGWYFQEDTTGDGVVDGNDWTSPIRWQIIKEEGTELVLLSDKVLDYMMFGGGDKGWKYSSLRTWLNGTFYTNAFTDEERGAILQTYLTDVSTDSEEYTEDYVYLLSSEDIEADTYGLNVSNQVNIGMATDYCNAVKTKYVNQGGGRDADGSFSWWLRDMSGGSYPDNRAVDNDGKLGYETKYYNGVRPVIRVDTSKLSFELYREKDNIGVNTAEWDRIAFGEYEGKSLNWRVLEVEDNYAYILSENIITEKAFHDVLEGTNWENCTLRSWLNNEFYTTAFTEEQQNAIITSYIRGDEHGYEGKEGWTEEESIQDKIFLLSYADVRNQSYGFPEFCCYSPDIFKQATCLHELDTEYWILRTTNFLFDATSVYNIWDTGRLGTGMIKNANTEHITTPYGIRPVLQLDLSKGGWEYVDSYKLGHDYTTRYLSSNTKIKVEFQPGYSTYYSGKPFTPKVTVKYNGELLQEGVHYTLSYRDNVECGTGAVILQGTGDYVDGVRYVSSNERSIFINEVPEYEMPESSPYVHWDIDVEYGQTEARQMLQKINAFRTGEDAWYWNSDNTEKIQCENLEELTYDYKLEEVAMLRAAEIAVAYGHGRPDGTSRTTAYSECGYYSYGSAENIAAGQRTEESAFIAWAEEDEMYEGQGHRRAMLSSKYKSVGIGHVVYGGRHFWVQEFSSYVNEPNETEAKDALEKVSIRIDSQYIHLTEATNFTMECGEVKDVNAIPLGIRVGYIDYYTGLDCETWPENRTLDMPVTWSAKYSDDEDETGECVLELNDVGVHALKAGESVLIPTVFGKDCGKLQVTVNHCEGECRNQVTATCTSVGYSGDLYCSGCGEMLQSGKELPLADHIPVTDEGVESTCQTEGKTTGTHCSVCNKILTEQQNIPKLEHKYTESILPATLKANGQIKNICSECGDGTSVSIPYPKQIRLTSSEGVYNGEMHMPKAEVTDAAGQSISEDKYRIEYAEGMIEPGSYVVTVTFTDTLYSGSVQFTYRILSNSNQDSTVEPPKSETPDLSKKTPTLPVPKWKNIKAGRKKLTLTWKKEKGIDGYEIIYSTSKKIKASKIKKVCIKKAGKTKLVIKKLKSKKKYYLYIRTYKKDSGQTYYSGWSRVKAKKVQ
ncbi:MAG: CAP domain-containing protein [Lachnospiraceae bacterium]|nr:CAP domain-containing protein [Lachnospiraceae bacterium]